MVCPSGQWHGLSEPGRVRWGRGGGDVVYVRDPASVDVGAQLTLSTVVQSSQSLKPPLIGLMQPRQSGAPHHTLYTVHSCCASPPRLATDRWPRTDRARVGCDWWLADVG